MTVGTLFHKTHLGLQKWFGAVLILRKLNPNISDRQLAKEIQVSRATASKIAKKIREADLEQAQMLTKIVHSFEQSI
ncbi:MAG: helix-turn-helix domain-containing protein [Phormidesmis sp.]